MPESVGWTRKRMADILGVGVETLRFYEKAGLIEPSRGANGYRRYSYDDYRRLLDIVSFREADMGLDDIKRLMFDNTLEENRKLFAEQAQAQRAEIERRRQLLDAFAKTADHFDFIERHLERPSVIPLAPQLLVTRRQYLDHRCGGLYTMLEEFAFRKRRAVLAGTRLCFAEEDARALGVMEEWKQNERFACERCAHTVVCAPGRSLPPAMAEDLFVWAEGQGLAPQPNAYSFYLAVAREGCYLSVFIPLG